MLELLTRLCNAPGVSGDESSVAAIITSEIKGHAEYKIDNLGNIIVFKKGLSRPQTRLMLCAHMDEVGLIVTFITETGLLKFDTVGGIDPRVIIGRRIKLSKSSIAGVIATKAVHLQNAEERKVSPDVDKLYIDIGAISREDALKYVTLGDTAIFDSDFTEFGDGLIKARALDDRVGCTMLIELIKSELPFDCHFAFTVQEEVGLRGAKTATYAIKPDAALVLETTTAADIPFIDDHKKVCYLGRGPVLSFMDGRTIYDRGLFDLALTLAEENGIRCQVKQAVAGGNDSGAIHISNEGVRTLAVSLPCRYLHSPCCVIKYEDLLDTLKLVRELLPAIAGAGYD
jgi:putative aminopeptidase FrvX